MSAQIKQMSGGCPVTGANANHAAGGGRNNRDWWPNSLNLNVLRQHSSLVNPMGAEFNYADEFKSLNLNDVKQDLFALMTDSQEWWPADYGHYGPFFIRMAWHVAGTYRTGDGRGGSSQGLQRFAPTNSWPDNANLDKARRLLWPVKQKYGRKISWADLFILAGNCAHESMGLKPFGFGGGRPDPLLSAHDIRETFGRMAMNDEETVALVAGGHTFGKCHGAGPDDQMQAEPNGANIEDQGFGWKNGYKSGKGVDTITSGIEGPWTPNPTQWDSGYFDMLFGYDWEKVKSPAGAWQWHPIDLANENHAPQVDGSDDKVTVIMTTADMALREDPSYREISMRFHKDQDAFADAYKRAWYKLTHRDMGPITRYLGSDVPDETLIWQDPLPTRNYDLIDDSDITELKDALLNSGLTIAQLIRTAWASASTYRNSDRRVENIQSDFNTKQSTKQVSIADLIILGGCAAIEKASGKTVPFTAGRVDATDDHTDAESFEPLEPETDAFRNFAKTNYTVPTEHLMIDRAQLLTLTAPEMTVLIGGLRVLNANHDGSNHGVFTDNPETLTNGFFVNLLDMGTEWKATCSGQQEFEGRDRTTGDIKWSGSRVDLIFGHDSELRAIAEVYATDDSKDKFVNDFIAAWTKVMELGRF